MSLCWLWAPSCLLTCCQCWENTLMWLFNIHHDWLGAAYGPCVSIMGWCSWKCGMWGIVRWVGGVKGFRLKDKGYPTCLSGGEGLTCLIPCGWEEETRVAQVLCVSSSGTCCLQAAGLLLPCCCHSLLLLCVPGTSAVSVVVPPQWVVWAMLGNVLISNSV